MKKLLIIAIPILLISGVLVGLREVSRSTTFQFFGQIVPKVITSEKVVALTFDDGPTTDITPQVLATLEEEGIHATFFVIGAELEKKLDEGRKIVAAGHELANHSYNHDRMIRSIILLHVMYPHRQESLKAVKKIVERLKAQGYSFKTVSELLKADPR